jgi:hypothetical protein
VSLSYASKKRAKQKHTEKKTKMKDNLQNSVMMMAREGEECKAGGGHV